VYICLPYAYKKCFAEMLHKLEAKTNQLGIICILANGKLQSIGSPLQLKRKSGIGYRLKLEVNDFTYRENEIMEIIHDFVPTARVLVRHCISYLYMACT